MTGARDTAVAAALHRHVGAFRACVSSPADAWLAARMALWALAIPPLKHVLPLPRLVRLAAASPRRQARHPAGERTILALSRWLYGLVLPPDKGCLQRSLLAYRYLGRANADPRLVVGMRKEGGTLVAHAWVAVDGEPSGEPAEWVNGFVPVMVFAVDGHRIGGATSRQ